MVEVQAAESYSIAVFPFLKTTTPVDIGGITFRSTDDTGGLSTNKARSVAEVAKMLFLQDDLRIKSERVEAIERYRSIGESGFPIKIVRDAMRLAAKVLLACEANLEAEVRTTTENLATAAESQDSYEVLPALQAFHEIGKRRALTGEPSSPWIVTYRLVDTGWDYVMWNYHSLRRKRETQTSDEGAPLA